MENLLLEMALKQRQSDLIAQRNTLLEKTQELEADYYSRVFRSNNSDNDVAQLKVKSELARRRLDVMEGQINEVKFWLFEILPTVG